MLFDAASKLVNSWREVEMSHDDLKLINDYINFLSGSSKNRPVATGKKTS